MKDAAKSQFDETMDSCMESATTSTAREACFSEAQVRHGTLCTMFRQLL